MLRGQLRSSLLLLLAVTAVASAFLGQVSDAVIIGVILVASVGLGFVNEYRAAKTAEALHSSIHHRCVAWRDGHPDTVDVTELVPGDVVDLQLGQVVAVTPSSAGSPRAWDRGQPETEFQAGLRKFSMLLVQVADVLTGAICIINVALHKPVITAVLFSLSIAVGISPQLLPAVVSTSLAAGSRQLARFKVLVKRLVCIEDLGDVDVLFTDKTGTLTEGSLRFMRSAGPDGTADDEPLLLGLLCNEAAAESGRAAGGNPLDVALWDSPAAARQHATLARYRRLDMLPFDHERRAVSVLAEDDRGDRMIITKGAPGGAAAAVHRHPRPPTSPGTAGAATACTGGPAASPPAPSARPADPIWPDGPHTACAGQRSRHSG